MALPTWGQVTSACKPNDRKLVHKAKHGLERARGNKIVEQDVLEELDKMLVCMGFEKYANPSDPIGIPPGEPKQIVLRIPRSIPAQIPDGATLEMDYKVDGAVHSTRHVEVGGEDLPGALSKILTEMREDGYVQLAISDATHITLVPAGRYTLTDVSLSYHPKEEA